MRSVTFAAVAMCAVVLAACGRPVEGAGDNWVNPGGDMGKTRYSRLADINTENVARLGFASSDLARVRAHPYTQELRAIEPLTGRTAWSVPLSNFPDRGGVLTTAGGLVLQGDLLGRLNVYDARNGRLLHSIETGSSIMAAPMTYRAGGVQYVAVMAGWGGGLWSFTPRGSAAHRRGNQGRILAFRLDGDATPLPELLPPIEVGPGPPPQLPGATAMQRARGRELFFANCAICHSNQYRSISPDLRRMQTSTHRIFGDIVRGGLYVPNGMPRWDDVWSEDDVDAIHAYLIDEQAATHRRELELERRGQPLDAQ